jgi:hypothetical protein
LHSIPVAPDQLAREFSIPPSPFVLHAPRAPVEAFAFESPRPNVVESNPRSAPQQVETELHGEPEFELPPVDINAELDASVFINTPAQEVEPVTEPAHDDLTSVAPADFGVPSVEFELPSPPEPPEPPAAPTPPAFKLDQARLARLQRDTAAVDQFLAGIFVETDHAQRLAPELESQPVERQLGTSVRLVADLDAEHSEVLLKLLEQDAWSRSELQELASRLDLMLDGALEKINDVAFDLGGGALVEDGGDIYVDAHVAAALRQALSA